MARVIVLGGGSIGKRHLRNLLASPLLTPADVFAVEPRADRVGEVAALGVPEANILLSRDAALAAGRYDGCIVATPTSMHYDDAIAMVEAGCHLMIEKPMGVDIGRAGELREAIARAGVFAFVAYCFRFDPVAQEFQRLIQAEAVGRPLYARAEMSTYLPEWHPHEDYRDFYMSKLALGGGTLLDQSHLYDMTRWFFGEMTEVFGLSDRRGPLEIETDDYGEFLFTMASGLQSSVHIDLFTRPWREFYQVSGERGTLEWNINRRTLTLAVDDRPAEVVMRGEDYNQMYIGELGYFLAAVTSGGNPPPGPRFDDGLRTMQIIEAIRESAGRRTVTLPSL